MEYTKDQYYKMSSNYKSYMLQEEKAIFLTDNAWNKIKMVRCGPSLQ